jgi:hypothetical protein
MTAEQTFLELALGLGIAQPLPGDFVIFAAKHKAILRRSEPP